MRPVLLALALVAGADLRRFDDAALHAVQFVDRDEGWAVGDAGVIWHTIDGGQSWERQPTGVRGSLRSVQFLNPYTGWAAGREELPGGGSAGVLLYTSDGGLKWRECARNTFPGLNRVRFLDGKTGFVVGDGTDQFPSGVFRTTDGGRTWQPVSGPRCPGWLAAEFRDADNGALVGAWSRLATWHDGTLGAADVDTLGGRTLYGLQLDGANAVAVGQGGVVLLSDTGGVRWGYANLKLPVEVLAGWDFHAVCRRGERIWIAGRPGSALLHSPDGGKSWQVIKTGQPLSLNGLYFADAQRGWAVGEFGSILCTADGGKNWKVQQRGGQRAGVLFVHARPEGLPVDTVAQIGGADGYLAAALRVHGPDPASAALSHASDPQRWAAAIGKAGGAAGEMLWQFPLPQHRLRADKRELLKAWDRLHADRAAEQYLRQLVLALRVWRPAVVVTDHPDPAASGYPADALLAEAVHEAFRRAADPTVFPEQLETLGLEKWQAQKLYGRWDARSGAQVILDTNEPAARLGDSPRDFAAPAAALLAESADAVARLPLVRYYRLLDSTLDSAANQRGLMDGIALAPGGTSRRDRAAAPELTDDQRKALRAKRNLQALAEAPLGDKTDSQKLLAQIGPSLASLPDGQASEAAYAVASQFARSGQWTLAREAYLYMVDRYPAHPRAADAYRWLMRYNSSGEARRRHELGQFLLVTNLDYRRIADDPKYRSADPLTGSETEVKVQGPVALASHTGTLTHLADAKGTRLWNQGCLDIAKRLAAFGPLYETDPALHFCLNAARRNLGDFDKPREWYVQFRNTQPDGPWKSAAAAETWLTVRAGPPPKALLSCRQTSTRPHLDGDFDDPCWKDLKPVVLKNAVGDTAKECATEVRMAYDREYLYLAVRCTHPNGCAVPPVKARQRDADLRPYDRVNVLLDVDRDYSTYYRLEVDQRGCVCEDCWGDRTWDPRWFVAAKSGPTWWQVEAAIPLTELTGDAIPVGKAWACNVVRVLPSRGVQALSLPADVQPRPEGMGLLMFMPEKGSRP